MKRLMLWIAIPLLLGAASLEGAVSGRRPAPEMPTPPATPFSEFDNEDAFWKGETEMAVIRGHLERPSFAERVRS
jgi:hypothetical protein